MEKLWTTTEAAKHLGMSEADVEQLVRQGRLTGYKLGGQFLRFRPDQVEALKEALRLRPSIPKRRDPRQRSWWVSARDFLYLYDFYLVSVACLALLVVYLIVS